MSNTIERRYLTGGLSSQDKSILRLLESNLSSTRSAARQQEKALISFHKKQIRRFSRAVEKYPTYSRLWTSATRRITAHQKAVERIKNHINY